MNCFTNAPIEQKMDYKPRRQSNTGALKTPHQPSSKSNAIQQPGQKENPNIAVIDTINVKVLDQQTYSERNSILMPQSRYENTMPYHRGMKGLSGYMPPRSSHAVNPRRAM